jgi:hypothetical protein
VNLLCRINLHARVVAPPANLFAPTQLMCRRLDCRARWSVHVLAAAGEAWVTREADA